jgi:hypothetical protein
MATDRLLRVRNIRRKWYHSDAFRISTEPDDTLCRRK